MSRANINLSNVVQASLLGLCVLLLSVSAAAEPAAPVAPPKALVDAGLVIGSDAEPTGDAALTWDQVLARVEPTPWPDVQAPPAAALPAEALDLLNQAAAASRRGEHFSAIEQLRQAEQRAPDHPQVVRALGLAYAESGNLTRAVSYLRGYAAAHRDDAEALLLLARHSAQRGTIEQALADCLALEKASSFKPLADLYRGQALARLGFTAAANEQLARAIDALQTLDPAAPDQKDDVPALVRRELGILKAILPQLRIELGDMFLRTSDFKQAAQTYADTQVVDPSVRHQLVARRVFLALVTGQRDDAIDLVVATLREPDTIAEDAALVDYLVQQGVPAEALAGRLQAVLDEAGVNQPRLQAFASVGAKDAVLAQISRWLGNGPLTPNRLQRVVSLFRFDDKDPADAMPLAGLLQIVSRGLSASPDQALAHARMAVGEIDAPVTLLRAIRSDAFTAEPGVYDRLVAAVVYESVDRRRDALVAYQSLLDHERLAEQVLPLVVDYQLELGMGAEALKLLGEPKPGDPWPKFELSLRALAAAGDVRQARTLVEQYIKENGKQLEPDTLRIEFIAQMGQPVEACNLLLRMIRSYPEEESLYRLGITIAYDYRDFFSREADSIRMRQAFLAGIMSNLPDSSLARIGQAMNIRNNPARLDEAKQLLQQVLEDEPENVDALSELYEIYRSTGDDASAEEVYARFVRTFGQGVPQALVLAERAITNGQMQEAVAVIDETFELDRQGVLPGRAMTADQASTLLRHLVAADPQRDTDALTLRFVRRFPNHAGLNNALGYRWATENKNLLQAKEMIGRALKEDQKNHSILDSLAWVQFKDSLAWVQYKLGQFDEAKATQEQALVALKTLNARLRQPGIEMQQELDATAAILNDHMGDICYQLGENNRAHRYWRIAMKQSFGEEQMRFDPELRTLGKRLEAKVDALAKREPVPVADVPGPESHGPEGHPADIAPEEGAQSD